MTRLSEVWGTKKGKGKGQAVEDSDIFTKIRASSKGLTYQPIEGRDPHQHVLQMAAPSHATTKFLIGPCVPDTVHQ